jgi:putative ABC transport system permease protein
MLFPYLTDLLNIEVSYAFLVNVETAVFIFVLWCVISLIAGFYPSIIIAGQTPIRAIGKPTKNSAKFSVRNALMVVQFVISLVLIISSISVTQQLKLFMDSSLGFREEAVITAKLPRNSANELVAIRQQLLASPYIKQVSFSNNSPSSEDNYMANIEFIAGNQPVELKTQMKFVDEYFLDLFEIELLEGEPLNEKDTTGAVLINETMMKLMQFSSANEVIGKRLEENDKVYTVKGVIKDFHVNSLHQKIDPTILMIAPSNYYQANIQINPKDLSAESIASAVKHIENLWENKFSKTVFKYRFLDETLKQVYAQELQTAKLVKVATIIALILSSMGLFGLAIFISSQRIKEIAVRKVLGATSGQIFLLLSQTYLKLIFVAVLIALPVTWWYLNQWLQNFAYRIDLEIWIFLTGISIIFLITIGTISYQLLKTSLINPANSLRNN